MRLILRNQCQPAEFWHFLNEIDDWKYLILPREIDRKSLFLKDEDPWDDVWFGTSSKKPVYALRIAPADKFDENYEPTVFAILIDPPKPNEDGIKEALLKARAAYVANPEISDAALQSIADSIKFPVYTKAGDLLPGLPDEWQNIPAEIELSIELSEGAGLHSEIFEEFRCTTFRDVLKALYDKRQYGLLLQYSLVAREITPLLVWDIDWPLSRAGKDKPQKRGKVSTGVPWDKVPDQTLLTVYQFLPVNSSGTAPYYGEPTVRLRAGGLTIDTAVANWHKCAKLLRAVKYNLAFDEDCEPSAPFRPQSAQDEQNEVLETAFFKEMLEKNSTNNELTPVPAKKSNKFEINVKELDKGVSESPTVAWRKQGWKGFKED